MIFQFIESILTSAYNAGRSKYDGSISTKSHPIKKSIARDDIILGTELHNPENGKTDGKSKVITLSADVRKRHIYILGATGTGKSNLLLRLIESDIAAGRTFCVFDLRGDLIDRVLLRMAALKPLSHWQDRIYLMDLRQEDFVIPFNPLAGSSDIHAKAFHMLSVLKQQSDSWGIQLEETLRNCLIALTATGWTILEIEPLLCNSAWRKDVLAGVSDTYVLSFFDRFDRLSDDQKTAWVMPVLNKISPLLAIPRLRRMLGMRKSLSYSDILDTKPGSAILVSLAVDRLHNASHLIGGLLISAFQTAIMARVDQAEKDRIPVNLYVDEFETMASDQFEAIVAEGRRFGLGLTLSHQNLSQMPVKLSRLLLNNIHNQFYFQSGAMDAEVLAREVGSAEKKKDIVRLFTKQKTGETIFIQRGHDYRRIKIEHCPDPVVDPTLIDQLKNAAYRDIAIPKLAVDKELQDRSDAMAALRLAVAPPVASVPKPTKTVTKKGEPYEIRHTPSRGKFKKDKPEKLP